MKNNADKIQIMTTERKYRRWEILVHAQDIFDTYINGFKKAHIKYNYTWTDQMPWWDQNSIPFYSYLVSIRDLSHKINILIILIALHLKPVKTELIRQSLQENARHILVKLAWNISSIHYSSIFQVLVLSRSAQVHLYDSNIIQKDSVHYY